MTNATLTLKSTEEGAGGSCNIRQLGEDSPLKTFFSGEKPEIKFNQKVVATFKDIKINSDNGFVSVTARVDSDLTFDATVNALSKFGVYRF